MRNSVFALAVAAFALLPGLALAGEASDRTEAIRLCRVEVALQTGLDVDDIRFDEVRVRARVVQVDLDVWRGRRLQNVRCDVARGESLAIASIEPALRSAEVQAATATAAAAP